MNEDQRVPAFTLHEAAARSTWAEWRRALLVLGSFLIVLIWVLSVSKEPGIILAGLAGGALLVFLLIVVVRLRIRKESVDFAHGAPFDTIGRFPFRQVSGAPLIAAELANVDPRPLRRWSMGLVEGRVRIDDDALVFVPGRVALKAQVPVLRFPWDVVREVRTLPLKPGVMGAVQLFLSDGGFLELEVRRLPDAVAAIRRILKQPPDNVVKETVP